MFGLEETEVISRRRYVSHVRKEIEVCAYPMDQYPIPDIHFDAIERACGMSLMRAFVYLHVPQVFQVEAAVPPVHHRLQTSNRSGRVRNSRCVIIVRHLPAFTDEIV